MPQRAKVMRVWRLRKGISSGRPTHSGWPALGRPSANRPGTSAAVTGPKAMRPAGVCDLDHRLEPEQAARAGAHDLDRQPAALRFVEDRGRHLVGADGAGSGIAWHEDTRGHRSTCRAISSIDCGVSRAIGSPSSMRRRRAGAEAQTIGRFDGDPAVGRRVAPLEAEAIEHLAAPAPRRSSTGRLRRGRASARDGRPACRGSRDRTRRRRALRRA